MAITNYGFGLSTSDVNALVVAGIAGKANVPEVVTLGSHAVPVTTSQEVAVTGDTQITIYANLAAPNVNITNAGSVPFTIEILFINEQGSGVLAPTISFNSETPTAWEGVVRNGGVTPVATSGDQKKDFYTCRFIPELEKLWVTNLDPDGQ